MSEATPAVAVTVLGGYLGAGKTTLVNHLLRTASERIVVLVNDFGAISIDDALIESASDDMITLANGCICCSLVDGLAAALEQVRSIDPPPARLVIEASGVGDPASIAAYAHGRGLRLDAVVTVVDAETVRARSNDRYVGDVVTRQLQVADLLVINKMDLVEPASRGPLLTWLASCSGGRPIIECVRGQVPLDALLGVDAAPRIDAPATHVVDANDRFETWSVETEETFDADALIAAVRGLPPGVVRMKGVVRTRGGERLVVHRVGARVDASVDGTWRGGPSRLVAIGPRAQLDAGAIDAALRRAQPGGGEAGG